MPTPQAPPPTPPAAHLGPIIEDRRGERHRFDAHELATVLSHYDLGVIERIREHRRGSRRAPKLRIVSEKGSFLLKRRAPGRDEPARVAFAHGLQVHLAEHGYPVAPIVRTRRSRGTLVRHRGRTYEVFLFIEGQRDDRTPAAAAEAGRALGRLHMLLGSYQVPEDLGYSSYHGALGLESAVRQIPGMVQATQPNTSQADLRQTCGFLQQAYDEAMRQVDGAGFGTWPARVLHGDWHPGNLLYRKGEIVAVLDFDSARAEPRIIDVANAALQFSMTTPDPDHPETWPDPLDVSRIRALIRGYDEASGDPIQPAERQVLPWLIIEALILESVVPIAATGRFAQLDGSAFLQMVERKVRWLRPRAARLLESTEG